jgi:hypothetical protein
MERPATTDESRVVDDGLVFSRMTTILTSRGVTPLRAVSRQALTDAWNDVISFVNVAKGLTVEPPHYDPANLPRGWPARTPWPDMPGIDKTQL